MHTTDEHLSELAVTIPAATRIFHRHRLDYCCGGKRSLASACADAGLDADALLAEIVAAATPGEARVADLAPEALVAHVMERYHAPLREDLPRLAMTARKVERVHAEKPLCPLGLGEHLETWGIAILDHMDKEEKVLFPSIAAPDPAVVAALSREHEDHAAALARTRELTGDLIPPPHACTTWRALYAGLEQMESELMEHVHLENHVLFPRALAR